MARILVSRHSKLLLLIFQLFSISCTTKTKAVISESTLDLNPIAINQIKPTGENLNGKMTEASFSTNSGILKIISKNKLEQAVVLNDADLLSDEIVQFVKMYRAGDQDFILGYTACEGSSCIQKKLFFIRLQNGMAPVIEKDDAFVIQNEISTSTTLSDRLKIAKDKIEVDLGVYKGTQSIVSIGNRTQLNIQRISAPIIPLSTEDCNFVKNILKDCSQIKKPCLNIKENFVEECMGFFTFKKKRALEFLKDQTTGLNYINFENACIDASTKKRRLNSKVIKQLVCNGARPNQWD